MNFEPEAESSELKNAEKPPDCEIKLSQWEGLCDWPIVLATRIPLRLKSAAAGGCLS